MPCSSVIYLTVTASAEKQEECYEAKRQKSELFLDCGSGDILYSLDDKTVTDLQGNYMLRIDKNTVMDLTPAPCARWFPPSRALALTMTMTLSEITKPPHRTAVVIREYPLDSGTFFRQKQTQKFLCNNETAGDFY